jgi:hypothetical protein
VKTKVLEVTNGSFNWGKFLIGRFDGEWSRESMVAKGQTLLSTVGWTGSHILVVDLQTGEGAIFMPGGLASHDLEKHRVWVCPLFEPMLTWLYKQDLADIGKLPDLVDLKDAHFEMSGYRREGPTMPAALEKAESKGHCSKCGGPIWKPPQEGSYICLDCLIKDLEGRRMR